MIFFCLSWRSDKNAEERNLLCPISRNWLAAGLDHPNRVAMFWTVTLRRSLRNLLYFVLQALLGLVHLVLLL